MTEQDLKIERGDDGEIEIDLLDLLYSWRQHAVALILSAVVCGALGFLYTRFLVTPEYSAASSIYAVSASSNSVLDLSDLNFGTSLTKDYVQLAKSRTMLERVIEDAGEGITVGRLRRMLSVANESGTRILEFTVTSTDPEQAMRLANAMADQAVVFLPEVMGVSNNEPKVIDYALLPQMPNNIRIVRNTGVGILLGLVLAAGVLTILYLLNDTFNSSEEIERYLGLTPMAMVPENAQTHKRGGYYYYTHHTKEAEEAEKS